MRQTAQLEEESESLLSHSDSSSPAAARQHNNTEMTQSTTLGLVRAYFLGALLNFAGFQFGYDSGMQVLSQHC